MTNLFTHTMTTGDVARALGITADRVRDFDAQLRPVRRFSGHRRYRPDVVRRFSRKRRKR